MALHVLWNNYQYTKPAILRKSTYTVTNKSFGFVWLMDTEQ